ncbi:MAG: hypothetical protein ACI8TP_004650 [Acidimicrobiales bacterium]|jgi:hypothetical protein
MGPVIDVSPRADVSEPFVFDTGRARAAIEEHGWVHVSQGLSDEFLATLVDQTERQIATSGGDLENWRFPGKKAQFLWELPETLPLETLMRGICSFTGMSVETAVMAERHIKVYSAEAEQLPPPHKDRSASTFTVGIAVTVPEASRLMLWPDVDRRPNPYPTSADWRSSRAAHDLPEVVIEGTEPVEVDMRPGDVVAFRGSEIYHERYRPSGTAVLYLKFNDLGLDPLGEDPRTLQSEERSRDILAHDLPEDGFEVSISPRLVGLRTEEFFPGGHLHVQARFVGSETGVSLEENATSLIRRISQSGSVSSTLMTKSERELAAELADAGVFLLG